MELLPENSHRVACCPATTPPDRWIQELQPDLVVLDISCDQDELLNSCEAVRGASDRPVVVLSEQRDEFLIARVLALGIDEYLALPVGDHELVARLDAMLRRINRSRKAEGGAGTNGVVLSALDLSVDLSGRKVFLSPTEFRLLSCLASVPGKVFTHDTLMSRVWGAEYVDSRHYLHLYIRYLREKLEPDPTRPEMIISEWGVGYRFQPPRESVA
jgi:two-component system KDP operon response regulator KdpE